MAGVQTGLLRVEDYLENWDFWTYDYKDFLMNTLTTIMMELEEKDEKDPSKLSEEDFENLEDSSLDMRAELLEFLASLTADRFKYRNAIATEPLVSGNPPSMHRKQDRPFFLGSSVMIDRKPAYVVLVMHSHAAGALASEEYIKAAEKFLEDSMRPLLLYPGGEKLYGFLMIGGKVSFYELRGKFSPVAGAKKWAPVTDIEVLSRMLGIVLRAWRTVRPQGIKAAIKAWIEVMGGTALGDGEGFTADSDGSYDERSSSDDSD